MNLVEGTMKIYQSSSFAKRVKKLEKNQKLQLDTEVKKIIQDPSIGSEKKGDLQQFPEVPLRRPFWGYCDLGQR